MAKYKERSAIESPAEGAAVSPQVAAISPAVPVLAEVEAPVVYRSYDPASLPQSNGHPANCVCVACLAAVRLG